MWDIEGMLIMIIIFVVMGKIISLMCSGVGGFIIGFLILLAIGAWASEKKG